MKKILIATTLLFTMGMTDISRDSIFIDINNGEVLAVLELLDYDLSTLQIDLTTAEVLNCVKDNDRMFNDRFQKELTLSVDGSETVTLTKLNYDIGAGIVNLTTKEPLNCT